MADLHHHRLERSLTELAAKFINQEASTQSLVTVTRLKLSEDQYHADIYISVLPEAEERAALAFVKNHLSELRDYVKKQANFRSLPHFTVDLDYEEKARQLDG